MDDNKIVITDRGDHAITTVYGELMDDPNRVALILCAVYLTQKEMIEEAENELKSDSPDGTADR